MFSFHKPKIYRSNLGCCICKAKSSSSRFTDSKKYENEFERCFRIEEKRSGEICNACVLLVKRWKKLSPENRLIKHWHHVVDARAGPGTKLTGNRRLTSSSAAAASAPSGGNLGKNHHHHHHNHHQQQQQQAEAAGKQQQQRPAGNRAEVLPLSSSQSNNNSQSAGGSGGYGGSPKTRHSSSFSSKVCAIDTNVSTFTFGEPPHRRSYMSSAGEPYFSAGASYGASSSSSFASYGPFSSAAAASSSSFAKPQSALNSSAFESVIKRFRQRQQQQKLEAQRRQLSRQRRQQRSVATAAADQGKPAAPSTPVKRAGASDWESGDSNAGETKQAPAKRPKRQSSDSLAAAGLADGLRVSTWLDNSIWRREKVCCGIIFRGLYNEVAIFPKLLKPCQCRLQSGSKSAAANKLASSGATGSAAAETDPLSGLRPTDSPPTRQTKSGSISSCDSNTSGTGSMDQQQLEEACSGARTAAAAAAGCGKAKQMAAINILRPRTIPSSARRRPMAAAAAAAARQTADLHSPSSSSGASSSRLAMMADDEDDAVSELVDGEGDTTTESSNDATSSCIDSLPEVEEGKQNALGTAIG